ncbi:MAG: hypothetical protein R6T83_01960 [Salinibacter sp.]
MRRRALRYALFAGLLLLTGCLPYSCRPQTDEALFPADSLSRQVAQQAPTDTLRQRWRTQGTDAHPLRYPRTVRFVGDSSLAVSDVDRNSLFRFEAGGDVEQEMRDDAFAVPYLAGVRQDTLIVFNAEANRFDWVAEGKRLPDRSRTIERPDEETLVYPLATDRHLYAKVVGEDIAPVLLRFDATGARRARTELPGPYWQRSGVLRAWGNRLVSVSGFRPVVHTVPGGFANGAQSDSLRLVGFDSPMLERSHAHAQGDAQKPPLLAASAAAVGDTLFVLNLRPGWVQIDAYDRQGQLQRRLVEPHDEANRNFYPVDLDVHRAGETYRFAVTVRSPEPQLRLLEWTATGPADDATAQK